MRDPDGVELLLLGLTVVILAAATIARALLVPLLAALLTVAGWRPAARRPQVPQERPKPTPVVHPLAVVGEELQALTVRELRALTGHRGRLRKHQLVAMAAAV